MANGSASDHSDQPWLVMCPSGDGGGVGALCSRWGFARVHRAHDQSEQEFQHWLATGVPAAL